MRTTSVILYNIFKQNLMPAIIVLFILTGTLCANPFFGEKGKSLPAPPVISGKTGSFTDIQFKYRDRIAELLREMKDLNSGKLIITLIAASFLYGLFHAAGPGHRKTIIFSLFLSRNAKFFEPAAAGFLSAGIHSGISMIIILIIWIIQKQIASLAGTERVYAYMEGFTFIILAALAIAFIIVKIRSFFSLFKKIVKYSDNKKLYSMIIVSSLVPCPGATMLLLLSIFLDLIYAGIIGVISMSVGMGIIISLSGYIAFIGRDRGFAGIKKNENLLARLSNILEIFSFLIILLFSVYMSLPFIFSFFS